MHHLGLLCDQSKTVCDLILQDFNRIFRACHCRIPKGISKIWGGCQLSRTIRIPWWAVLASAGGPLPSPLTIIPIAPVQEKDNRLILQYCKMMGGECWKITQLETDESAPSFHTCKE